MAGSLATQRVTQHIIHGLYLAASIFTTWASTHGRDGELFLCVIFNGVLFIGLLVYHLRARRIDKRLYIRYFSLSILISLAISILAIRHLDGMGGMMVVIAPFFNIMPIVINTIYLRWKGKFGGKDSDTH